MFLKLLIIFIFLIILFYLRNITKLNRNKKNFKAKKVITLNKNNLYNWMNLTKKERYNLSKQESINYLDKRKALLEEIRKEYKKISGGNSEEKLKEK
mgnify:CR=1 FL=1